MADNNSLETDNRFKFGKNWHNFLKNMNEDRISEAIFSLQKRLSMDTLKGKTFLDIGSGSGLFSLAAHRLGAQVSSFDYDQESVACTNYLKENYMNPKGQWTVQQGSVLDQAFLSQFGEVDILYSWGVLHHTGHMYQAFENIVPLVKKGGHLFISIYNDQGPATQRWKWIKALYTRTSSSFVRFLLCLYTLVRQWSCTFFKDMIKHGNPLKTWQEYGKGDRGMSPWYDIVDWAGGYPFEVAMPEEVFTFFKDKGFTLVDLKTCRAGVGCNEFVFIKHS